MQPDPTEPQPRCAPTHSETPTAFWLKSQISSSTQGLWHSACNQPLRFVLLPGSDNPGFSFRPRTGPTASQMSLALPTLLSLLLEQYSLLSGCPQTFVEQGSGTVLACKIRFLLQHLVQMLTCASAFWWEVTSSFSICSNIHSIWPKPHEYICLPQPCKLHGGRLWSWWQWAPLLTMVSFNSICMDRWTVPEFLGHHSPLASKPQQRILLRQSSKYQDMNYLKHRIIAKM